MYMPLSTLIVFANALNRGHMDLHYENLGRGHIVIGDLGLNTEGYPRHEWENAQDYLLHHIALGGGVIIGDNGWTATGNITLDFAEALRVFEEVNIE